MAVEAFDKTADNTETICSSDKKDLEKQNKNLIPCSRRIGALWEESQDTAEKDQTWNLLHY